MEEINKKSKIATFRFGVIADFVTGVHLQYGEKERLLNEKASREYDVPFSPRNIITRSTIEKWILDYKKGGFRIEALHPKERIDKGKVRTLSSSLKLAIKELKKEDPKLKVPAIVKLLKHKKLVGSDEKLNFGAIYRYLKDEELNTVNEDAKDKRLFEAIYPNELWQSDVMHGPYVVVDGCDKKSYLIAIIDDHSRFIVHAEFYLAETRANLIDCLRQAVLKRGLPQKLYVDNGSCFRALHLDQVAAQLGIAIHHSRPYIPQGRGKIERWFKYVRDNFLASQKGDKQKLSLLNHYLEEWVYEYNNKVHGTTKQTPLARYQANIECVRPAPPDLLNYLRQCEFRRVKKDRTVRLMGHLFEVPVCLIDRQVELRFHAEDLSQVEVYFQNKSYGFVTIVDPHINGKIGRNWDTSEKLKNKTTTTETLKEEETPQSGKLSFEQQEELP